MATRALIVRRRGGRPSFVVLLSTEDYDWVSGLTVSVNGEPTHPYAQIQNYFRKGKHAKLHRLVAERVLGRSLVAGECVDHKNRNTLDNRRENLRVCSHSENSRNTQLPAHNTSGLKGATYFKRIGRWRAQIKVAGRCIHLGYFSTAEAAHRAYHEAAVTYHGEFASPE